MLQDLERKENRDQGGVIGSYTGGIDYLSYCGGSEGGEKQMKSKCYRDRNSRTHW